jgi:hypothetical protein
MAHHTTIATQSPPMKLPSIAPEIQTQTLCNAATCKHSQSKVTSQILFEEDLQMAENNAVIRLNPMEMEVLCAFHAGTLSATFDRLCAAENAETDIARKREIRKLVRILPAFGPDAVVCLDFYSPNQSGEEPIVEPNYARMYSKLLDA